MAYINTDKKRLTKNNNETILSSIATSVHRSINLPEVLENAVESLSANIENVDYTGIYIIEGDVAVLHAYRGFSKDYVQRAGRIRHPLGFTWRTIEEKAPLYCPNAVEDTCIGQAGKDLGTKSYLSIPIKSNGDVAGTININSLKYDAFNADDLKLLEIIARQIEIAVNNAKQAEALKESEQELKKTQGELKTTVHERTQSLLLANQELEYRIRLRKLLTELSIHFINLNSDEIDEGINQALKKIGEFADADRSYIFLFRNNYEYVDNTHEWCSNEAQPEIQNLKNIPAHFFPWAFKCHKEGQILNIPNVSELPPEAIAEKREFEREGIKSLICVPIGKGSSPLGFLGLDAVKAQKNWDENIIDLLQIAAQMFAGAMMRKLSEQTLRESEERYRKLIENTYDLIVEINAEGKYLYVSPNHQELLGYKPEELNGQRLFNYIHPDEQNKTLVKLTSFIYEPNPEQVVYRFKHKSGDWRWLESAGKPFITADGETRAVIATRDVTERKKSEEKLKKALSEVKRLKNRLQAENQYLQEEIKTEYNFHEIIGKSRSLGQVLNTVSKVAPTDTTVLVTGETGTGKELVARAVHDLSPRENRPLVKVNCGAISAGLVESELFGHEKGAFTGAEQKKIGRFELANGGTIFLDEISELSKDSQVKLLRVIQEGEIERVGGTETIKVDVRIIAATNRNLEDCMQEGSFRSDLFYRLNVFPILVPPLRERKEDIELLANYFAVKFSKKIGKRIEEIPETTLKQLLGYDWPGNVRELENIIERAVILAKKETIDSIDLPEVNISSNGEAETNGRTESNQITTLEDIERTHILRILDEKRWVIGGNKGAAAVLNINPSTLRSRMRKLGITKSQP